MIIRKNSIVGVFMEYTHISLVRLLNGIYNFDMRIRYLQTQMDDFYFRGDIYSRYLFDVIDEFQVLLEYYIDRLNEIRSLIDLLEDDTLKLILEYKYVQYKSFDEIAELMFFSSRHVRRLHSKAISKLLDIINTKALD